MKNTKLRVGTAINATILIDNYDTFLYGFNFEFTQLSDYRPWLYTENGSWTGALGHIFNGSIDIVHERALMSIERQRKRVCENDGKI
jgi:hypothetical protein